jgi:hypothetical protein
LEHVEITEVLVDFAEHNQRFAELIRRHRRTGRRIRYRIRQRPGLTLDLL